MARKEQYLVGLDVGTSKIAVIVGEVMEGDELDIIGIGGSESEGIKRGAVVNLEAAVESIKKAVEEAELRRALKSMRCIWAFPDGTPRRLTVEEWWRLQAEIMRLRGRMLNVRSMRRRQCRYRRVRKFCMCCPKTLWSMSRMVSQPQSV